MSAEMLKVSPGDWEGIFLLLSLGGIPQLGSWAFFPCELCLGPSVITSSGKQDLLTTLRGPASPQDDAACQALAASGEALASVNEMPKTLVHRDKENVLPEALKSLGCLSP